MRLLLEKGATLDQQALAWAAENGHEAVVRLLLEKEVLLQISRRWRGAARKDMRR